MMVKRFRSLAFASAALVLFSACGDGESPAGPATVGPEALHLQVPSQTEGSVQFRPPVGNPGPPTLTTDPDLLPVLAVEVCSVPAEVTDAETFVCGADGSTLVALFRDGSGAAGETLDLTGEPGEEQFQVDLHLGDLGGIGNGDDLLIRVFVDPPQSPGGASVLGDDAVFLAATVVDMEGVNPDQTLPLKFLVEGSVLFDAYCEDLLDTSNPLFETGETCAVDVPTQEDPVVYFPDADDPTTATAAVKVPEDLFGIVVRITDLPNPGDPCLPIPNDQVESCLDISSMPVFADRAQADIKIQSCLEQGVDPEHYRFWRRIGQDPAFQAERLDFDPQNEPLFPGGNCTGFQSVEQTAFLDGPIRWLARSVAAPVWSFLGPRPLVAGHISLTSLTSGFSNFGWAEDLGLSELAGPDETEAAGSQIDVAVLVQQLLHNGQPDGVVADVPVTFTVTEGDGTVSGTVVVLSAVGDSEMVDSDQNGEASVTWTLGQSGTQTLVATIAGEYAGDVEDDVEVVFTTEVQGEVIISQVSRRESADVSFTAPVLD